MHCEEPGRQPVVQAPCTAAWDSMSGTNRVRFCTLCSQSVHNLSALTPSEVSSLLAAPGEQLCVRFSSVLGDGAILFEKPTVTLGGRLAHTFASLLAALLVLVPWASDASAAQHRQGTSFQEKRRTVRHRKPRRMRRPRVTTTIGAIVTGVPVPAEFLSVPPNPSVPAAPSQEDAPLPPPAPPRSAERADPAERAQPSSSVTIGAVARAPLILVVGPLSPS
jgi:hypothetical protein